MISKEEFKNLVDTVCLSKNMTQGELSKDMGYGENYISEMLTDKGKLTEKFYSVFKIRYQAILENPKVASNKSIDNLTEVVLMLTRNNERLTKMLEVKINSNGSVEAFQSSEEEDKLQPRPRGRMGKALDIKEMGSTVKNRSKRDSVSEKGN